MDSSVLQRSLLVALVIVCLFTLVIFAHGVDWRYAYRSRTLVGATFAFCTGAVIGLSPYALLLQILQFKFRTWVVPLLAFILIVAPAPIFLFHMYRQHQTGEYWVYFYLLVPIVQFFIALPLLLLAAFGKWRLPT